MPSARYWRITCLQSISGALSLSELQLYGSAGRLDASATMSCSHTPTVGSLSDLADGSAATPVAFSASVVRSPGFFIAWDLGTAQSALGLRLGGGATLNDFLRTARLEYFDTTWKPFVTLGRYVWPGALTLQPNPGAGNSRWSSAKALFHLGGSTPYAEFSPGRFLSMGARAQQGGVTLETNASALNGSWSVFTGSSRITTTLPVTFAGTDDFSIKFRFRRTTALATGVMVALDATTRWAFFWQGAAGGKIAVYNATSGTFLSGTTALATGTTYTYCFSKSGSACSLYLNGALEASATNSVAASSATLALGGSVSGEYFQGAIEELEIYGASMSAPDAAVATAPFVGNALAQTFEPLGRSAAARRALFTARDIEFGGDGVLAGITKVKGASSDTPTRARVSIFRLRDKKLARQVWSDAATGFWEVRGLDTDVNQYIAVAEYPSNPLDPNAENYLRPVVGVSPLEIAA